MDKNENYTIYVTGFGPFVGHEKVNASWEAVKHLPTEHCVNGKNLEIRLLEIPVVYEEVDRYVDEIWKENPKLVIHCGVNGDAKNILLEKHSYNGKYCRPDWSGKCLSNPNVWLSNNRLNDDKLSTKIDVDKIANQLNSISVHQSSENEMFKCSTEVGSYLCGYIYLKSLDIDAGRTLFIHVPPVNSPFTIAETTRGIFNVLEKCVQQLHDCGKL